MAKQIKRLLSGDIFECLPVVAVDVMTHGGLTRTGQRHENRADRLQIGASRWARYSRDGNGVISPVPQARSFSHFTSNTLTHGAMLFEGCCPHSQKVLFGLIAVRDKPTGKNLGSPGNIRDPVGEQAARA